MGRKRLVPGAIAYWDCTQVQGQVLPDLSGNGYHGTLGSTAGADTNDPTAGPTGLTFGGDDWVSLGISPAMEAAVQSGRYTIIAVFTPTAMNDYNTVFGKVAYGGANEYGIGYRSSGNLDVFLGGNNYPGDSANITIASMITQGTPVMTAATYDDNMHIAYRNGSNIGSRSLPGIRPVTSGTLAYIGRRVLSATLNATMIGHAFVVYPFALSQSQMAQEYAYFRAKFAPLGVILP